MKVVLNKCYGGFGLSDEALKILGAEFDWEVDRADPALVSLMEEKGSDFCSDRSAKLEIVDVPDGITDSMMDDYDGIETIIYVLDGKLYRI